MSNLDPVEAWVAAQDDRPTAEALVAFARCLNLCDRDLEALLAPDVTHDSQVRWDPLEGRDAVVSFFLRQDPSSPRWDFCELAVGPPGLPRVGACVLIHHRDSHFGRPGLGEPRSMITLDLDETGRVRRSFSACLVPHPGHASRSGLFPGLDPVELERERRWVGEPLADRDAVGLHLFHLPELGPGLAAYRDLVDALAADLGLPLVRLEPMGAGSAASARFQVVGHPTLVLSYRDRRVRQVEGVRSRENLEEELGGALVGTAWAG